MNPGRRSPTIVGDAPRLISTSLKVGREGEEGRDAFPAAGTPVRDAYDEWSDEDEECDEDASAADEECDERFLDDGDSQPTRPTTTPAPTGMGSARLGSPDPALDADRQMLA